MSHQPDQFIEVTIVRREVIRYRPDRTSILVPVEEWDSLTARIRACKTTFPFWTVTYSVAFGIAITAGLSIIPVAYAPQLPNWVFTTYVTTSAVGFVGGIISVIAERVASRRQQSDIDGLVVEMERRKSSSTATQPEATIS